MINFEWKCCIYYIKLFMLFYLCYFICVKTSYPFSFFYFFLNPKIKSNQKPKAKNQAAKANPKLLMKGWRRGGAHKPKLVNLRKLYAVTVNNNNKGHY
jgi:hypothetical protein